MPFEPEKITKEHVLEAIRLIKAESKALIPSTGYDVIIDGIPYTVIQSFDTRRHRVMM